MFQFFRYFCSVFCEEQQRTQSIIWWHSKSSWNLRLKFSSRSIMHYLWTKAFHEKSRIKKQIEWNHLKLCFKKQNFSINFLCFKISEDWSKDSREFLVSDCQSSSCQTVSPQTNFLFFVQNFIFGRKIDRSTFRFFHIKFANCPMKQKCSQKMSLNTFFQISCRNDGLSPKLVFVATI